MARDNHDPRLWTHSGELHVAQVVVNHHHSFMAGVRAQIPQINQRIAAQDAEVQTLAGKVTQIGSDFQAQAEERKKLDGGFESEQLAQVVGLIFWYGEINEKRKKVKISANRELELLEYKVKKLEEENRELEKLYVELASTMNELEDSFFLEDDL